MRLITSILAFIGLIAIVAILAVFIKAQSVLAGFDPEARATYANIAQVLLQTGNPAEATVWKAPQRSPHF